MDGNSADYKSMYFYLSGKVANAVDSLSVAVRVLSVAVDTFKELNEELKQAQIVTEDIFIKSGEMPDEEDDV